MMANAQKAMLQVSKGSDKKEDVLLIMNANENWDRFFVPAPLAISLLGELLLVSADRDISLRQRPPEGGFKLLKFPDSLRACLVQVSNEGWMAFNEAHTSMDQIRLLSTNVESHIRNAVKLLLGGSVSEIENVLPISLNKVEEIADSCLELASKTEAKFIQVMELTAEILEACTASKGYYEEKQQETETALKVARKQKELAEEKQKMLTSRLETTAKEVEKAQEKFDSALKDIPSTGDMLGVYIVKGAMDSLKSAISIISLSNPKRLAVSAAQSLTGLVHSPKPKEMKFSPTEQITDEGSSNCDALRIISIVKGMEKLIMDGSCMSIETKKSVDYCKLLFKKELETLESSFDSNSTIANILKKAITISSEFSKYIEEGQKNEKEEKQLQKRTHEFLQHVLAYEVKIKKDNALPLESSKTPTTGQNDQSLTDEITGNVRFKTEVAKQMLSETKEKHDKAYADLQAETDRLHATLLEMQSLDITKIEFDEIRSTLCKGIKALAEVRSQWSRLCQFFQMISNLIKCSLHSTLKTFVGNSRKGSEIKVQGESISNVYKEMLLEQAGEANRVAFVVQNISTAYVKISSEYLMDGITSLGHLIPLDPKHDQAEMIQRRANLHSCMEKASASIKSIIAKNKRDFDEKLQKRVDTIKMQVEAIMPAIPEEKMKEIQMSVEKGFSDSPFSVGEEDDYM